MTHQKRAADLVKISGELSKREALDLARRDWSNAVAKRVALARVKAAQAEVDGIIQAFASARPAHPETAAALDAQYEAALEAIGLVLRTAASAEMRLGQLQGVRRASAEHLDEIANLDRAEPSSRARDAATAAKLAKTAVKGMKAFADNPFESLDGATKFWNKTWQKLSSTRFTKPLSKLTVREGWVLYDELFTTNRVSSEQFKTISRFLGIAAAGLIVSSVILRTIADEANWGSAFAKSGLAATTSVAAGALITGASVNTALASTGTAITSVLSTLGSSATVTLEVPPVAAFIAATAVVVLIGVAAVELFDFLIDTWFGGSIPPSMRLEMATPMARSMKAQMASSMFKSMT